MDKKVIEALDELTVLADAIQGATVTPICCGNPTEDHGYVCCGQLEPDWPEWAVEAMSKAISVRDKLRAYLTDPGYRRVPVEPTDAMCEAGVVEALRHIVPLRSTITAGQVYKAMLSASQGEGE